jgi:predicted esterase
MKNILCCLLVMTAFAAHTGSAQVIVPFLEHQPVIDGVPDASVLDATVPIPLAAVKKSNDRNPDFNVRLRMAYGTGFLYLLIEVDADSITYRDRSYQNGDGFHCTIAHVVEGGAAADEFYVLRFSPGNDGAHLAPGLSVWYYNIDLQRTKLGPGAQLKTSAAHGTVYYEAAIPWTDVHPYHPFSGRIGFNLCFVKAIGRAEKNDYFLVNDERMQWEGQHRKYLIPEFQVPRSVTMSQAILSLQRNTIAAGAADTAVVHYLASRKGPRTIVLDLGEGARLPRVIESRTVKVHEGMNEIIVPLHLQPFRDGIYTVHCTVGADLANAAGLTILPRINFDSLRAAISHAAELPEGTRTTLLFGVEQIERRVGSIRPYENGASLWEEIIHLQSLVHETTNGTDGILARKGILRRAFRSLIDSTLRPYTVNIPLSYDPRRSYPLFVYLHGSGENDAEALSHTALTEGDWIECAPNGRGVSNCFTVDHAQEDIDEAIADVLKNYSVDRGRIVIAGFSMGGYGAYRSFYEHPDRYCGVAILSGHPNLASQWIGPGHPDFLDTAYLPPFKNIHMFIYHNENDRNCPFELTQEAIKKLTAAGAILDVVTTKEGGHTQIDDASKKPYYQWLKARAGHMRGD